MEGELRDAIHDHTNWRARLRRYWPNADHVVHGIPHQQAAITVNTAFV